MYYVFNAEGNCICSCDIEPNVDDLGERNESVVQHTGYFDITKIRFVDGQIHEKDSLPPNNEFETEDADSSISNEIMDMAEIILDMSDAIKTFQKGGETS